jgi:hypothetical protein
MHRIAPSAIVTAALALAHPAAHAGDMNCENTHGVADAVTCHVLLGAVLSVGTVVVALSSLKEALLPGTDVQVQMPDGRVVAGRLTSHATSGRDVRQGDLVKLARCTDAVRLGMQARAAAAPASASEAGPARLFCSLEFTRRSPAHSPYLKGNPRYGEQSDWGIRLDHGVPDTELLRLKDEPPRADASGAAPPASAPGGS